MSLDMCVYYSDPNARVYVHMLMFISHITTYVRMYWHKHMQALLILATNTAIRAPSKYERACLWKIFFMDLGRVTAPK